MYGECHGNRINTSSAEVTRDEKMPEKDFKQVKWTAIHIITIVMDIKELYYEPYLKKKQNDLLCPIDFQKKKMMYLEYSRSII